jgi:hypothetical protein
LICLRLDFGGVEEPRRTRDYKISEENYMLINNIIAKTKIAKRRPLGVWVLTIFGLVFGGVYPLSLEPLDLLMGYIAFYSTKEIPIIKIGALLNVAIILTSILAWNGSRIGQILFLISIIILFG